MTKNKKRKAHTRALAKERDIPYRTALHQEQSGGTLPPDFRVELKLQSFRNEPPHGLRLRVPGVESLTWLDSPPDARRVMEQVTKRVQEEFPRVLEDFRRWQQLDELPQQDDSIDEHEWTDISFSHAHREIEAVLLGAVEHVGWGPWGEDTPYDLLLVPTLQGMFEVVEESLMTDATDDQKAAFKPLFVQACQAASRLDTSACAAALKEADSRLRTMGWQPLASWEADEEDWEHDEHAYTGPEEFTQYRYEGPGMAPSGEEPAGLVLRNGDEYVVKAQGRVKFNDGRRCILLSHGAPSARSTVRVRFLDSQEVVKMDAGDLIWVARGQQPPARPRRLPSPLPSISDEPDEPLETEALTTCLVKKCGQPGTQETLFCALHVEAYRASADATWPQAAGVTEIEWELIRQFSFAVWVSTADLPGLAVPPDTEESQAQRAIRFEALANALRDGKERLSHR